MTVNCPGSSQPGSCTCSHGQEELTVSTDPVSYIGHVSAPARRYVCSVITSLRHPDASHGVIVVGTSEVLQFIIRMISGKPGASTDLPPNTLAGLEKIAPEVIDQLIDLAHPRAPATRIRATPPDD